MGNVTEINFKGMRERVCATQGGENASAMVVNMRMENDVLVPVGEGREVMKLEDSTRRVLLVIGDSVLTVVGRDVYHQCEGSDVVNKLIAQLPGLAIEAHTIGNVVIVLTDVGMYYIMKIDNTFKALGTMPDMPLITFRPVKGAKHNANIGEYVFEDEYLHWDMPLNYDDVDNYSKMYNDAYAKILHNVHKSGEWCQPIMVRYAMRMIDGTYIYPSPPILLSSDDVFQLASDITETMRVQENRIYSIPERALSVSGYKVGYTVHKCELREWSSVIRGIDIFVSAEAELYNGESMIEYYTQLTSQTGAREYYLQYRPPKTDEWILEKELIEGEKYYLLATIDNLDNVSTSEEVTLPLSFEYSTLRNRDILEVDNSSFTQYIGGTAMQWNNKLMVGNIKQRCYSGHKPQIYFRDLENKRCYAYTVVTLATNEGERTVVSAFDGNMMSATLSPIITYPDERAINFYMRVKTSEGVYDVECPLKAMKGGGFAYYITPTLKPIEMIKLTDSRFVVPATINGIEYMPEKIILSSDENPFLFPKKSQGKLSNDILGLALACKAFSQGQWGEYPIYVFTGGGAYGMKSGDERYVSTRPLMQSDSIISKSIVQTDTGVCFVDNAAIWLIHGSSVEKLYDLYHSPNTFMPITEIVEESVSDNTPIYTYMKGAVAGWIHSTQEVVWHNVKYGYALVYNMNMKSFYRRTVAYTSLYSRSGKFYAVNNAGLLLDINDEVPQDRFVAVVTYPQMQTDKAPYTITHITWRMKSLSASLYAGYYGSYSEDGTFGKLRGATIDGVVTRPLVFHTIYPYFPYYCFFILGKLSADSHLCGITLRYNTLVR